jgi:hypothetical protein
VLVRTGRAQQAAARDAQGAGALPQRVADVRADLLLRMASAGRGKEGVGDGCRGGALAEAS